MRVVELCPAGELRLASGDTEPIGLTAELLQALALCNDAQRDATGKPAGDPTETALWQAAADAGFDKRALDRSLPRRLEFAFDSERKRMTTFHGAGSTYIAYTKGAPEAVLERVTSTISRPGEPVDRAHLAAVTNAMAADGLRVLAIARRRWNVLPGTGSTAGDVEQDLMLLGFVGLFDAPRPEVRTAVAKCKAAGIRPVMITGDHPGTAQALARTIGMLEEGDQVMTGRELEALSDTTLAERVGRVAIFARVDPAQKIRIAKAIRATGQYVAITSDGVNDAPALVRADIGIAMGKVVTGALDQPRDRRATGPRAGGGAGRGECDAASRASERGGTACG